MRQAIKDFIKYKILGVNDSPHRIALGVAIAIFITFTPTIPLQMILTVTLCAIFKANKIVGLPLVWISNPITVVPIYVGEFWLGCKLTPTDCSWSDFNQQLIAIRRTSLSETEWMAVFQTLTTDFFWPLMLGGLVIGAVLAIPSYPAAFWAVKRYAPLKEKIHEFQEKHHIHLPHLPHPHMPHSRIPYPDRSHPKVSHPHIHHTDLQNEDLGELKDLKRKEG